MKYEYEFETNRTNISALYLQNTYNFILEWYDGHGYCYICEAER